MALVAREPEGEGFVLLPEGVFQAIAIWIYDLGTQFSEKWDKESRRVLITWEIPSETMEDGRPMVVSKEYTLSLHEKSQLRKDLSAWRGKAFTPEELKGFDLKNILGSNCQLQIIHNTSENKTYANIASIMSMPKGLELLKPKNKMICYEIMQGIPADTPEWISKKILASKEFTKTVSVPKEETALEPF